MDQKEIVTRMYTIGIPTVEKLIKVLYMMLEGSYYMVKEHIPEGIVAGENNVYTLLNAKDSIISEVLPLAIDLKKVKDLLNEYHIAFAFNPTENGNELYFKAQDYKIMQHAIKELLMAIKEDPEQTTKRILRKPNQMTFEERLAYLKRRYYKGNLGAVQNLSKGVRLS